MVGFRIPWPASATSETTECRSGWGWHRQRKRWGDKSFHFHSENAVRNRMQLGNRPTLSAHTPPLFSVLGRQRQITLSFPRSESIHTAHPVGDGQLPCSVWMVVVVSCHRAASPHLPSTTYLLYSIAKPVFPLRVINGNLAGTSCEDVAKVKRRVGKD